MGKIRTKEFRKWLKTEREMKDSSISSRISNVSRVENAEGDLNNHYLKDRFNSLLSKLEYSKMDFDMNQEVNHNVIIKGNLYTGTATLKAAVKLYLEFCNDKMNQNSDINSNINIKVQKKIVQPISKVSDNKEKVDSYSCFFKQFNITKSDFYKFGLENTIYPPIIQVEEYWDELKKRVMNNKSVCIRGYGRDAHGTELYKQIHVKIFGNKNIEKDKTNNSKPQKIIEELTGYKRNKNLFNYQVSHIFGMTRNALMFESPWNIALVPKIIDPLTGHESNGDWAKEYQKLFLNNVYDKYEKYIYEYNDIACKYDFEKQISKFVIEDAEKILRQYSYLDKQDKLQNNMDRDFRLIIR